MESGGEVTSVENNSGNLFGILEEGQQNFSLCRTVARSVAFMSKVTLRAKVGRVGRKVAFNVFWVFNPNFGNWQVNWP